MIQWWVQKQLVYPVVADATQQLLCIPATSVPSERLCSKTGDVITKKRNSLKPNTADRVIFDGQSVIVADSGSGSGK